MDAFIDGNMEGTNGTVTRGMAETETTQLDSKYLRPRPTTYVKYCLSGNF